MFRPELSRREMAGDDVLVVAVVVAAAVAVVVVDVVDIVVDVVVDVVVGYNAVVVVVGGWR